MISARVSARPTAWKSSSPSATRPCPTRSRPRARRRTAPYIEPLSAADSTGASASCAEAGSPVLDVRLDEHAAVQDAVEGWCWELGCGEGRPGVSLSGDQVAASEREPAAVGQADGGT